MHVILTQSHTPQNKTKQNKKTSKTKKDPQNCKKKANQKTTLLEIKLIITADIIIARYFNIPATEMSTLHSLSNLTTP